MKVISANHLHGGHVVFWSKQENWVTSIFEAEVFESGNAFDEAFAKAGLSEKGDIVGVYELDVRLEGTKPVPLKIRERIRVDGPSVPYGEGVVLNRFYAA